MVDDDASFLIKEVEEDTPYRIYYALSHSYCTSYDACPYAVCLAKPAKPNMAPGLQSMSRPIHYLLRT